MPANHGRRIERLLGAAEKYRPQDADAWLFFLRGLWLSGLRLGEGLQLSWERDGGLSVEISDGRPFLRIKAEAEKGFKDRLIPTMPDFGRFLLDVPEAERCGRVFKLNGLLTHNPIIPKRVSRIISAIGKKAGVVVNKEQENLEAPTTCGELTGAGGRDGLNHLNYGH